MRLITWNVNGIRSCYSKGLKYLVENLKPDILCLQETKASLGQVSEEIKTLGFPYFYWSEAQRKGYSGVATFLNIKPMKITNSFGFSDYDQEGRVLITEFKDWDLYNIYFPNGGSGELRHQFKQKFLKDLLEHLKLKVEQQRSMIIVGDYNIAPYPIDVYDPIKLANESGFLPEEREWFQKFFALGFVDTFREFFPNNPHRYTWWSYREFARVSNRGWRIDFICITRNLLPKLKSANLLEEVMGSDHCPVIAEFSAF